MVRSLKQLKNNRGSGIVTALVAIFFLTALGSMLLMLSYTSYEIKVAERNGKENFYDATCALDELRVGIQGAVSDALNEAYAKTVVNYSYYSTAISRFLGESFQQSLLGWRGETVKQAAEDGKEALFFKDGNDWYYQPDVLSCMIRQKKGECSVSSETKAVEFDGSLIVLKDICVTCTLNGYTTSVTSDITIDTPKMNYSLSNYSVSGIPEYCVVVNGALHHNGGQSEISGSIFADHIDLTSSSSQLRLTGNSTLVCKNDITIRGNNNNHDGNDNGRFLCESGSAVWAKNIDVRTNGNISLLGQSYIQNDLMLNGSDATATLGGSYCGFGSDTENAALSSAILANAQNTALRFNGLENLTLAGFGFIGSASGTNGSAVRMGESLTVKPDQQLYLIPADMLIRNGESIPGNPEIFESEQDYDRLSTAVQLRSDNSLSVNEHSYEISIQRYCQKYDSQYVSYYFMRFPDVASSNQYFQDYFTEHPEHIAGYLDSYLRTDGTLPATDKTLSVAGNVPIKKQADQTMELSYAYTDSFEDVRASAAVRSEWYQNLCKTLNIYEITGTEETETPFDFIVNTNELNALSGTVEYKDGDDVIAVVVNGDYTYDGDDKLHIIIANGNVTLSKNYNGLLLASGDVTLASGVNLTANADEVLSAYKYKDSELNSVGKYFRVQMEEEYEKIQTGDADAWDIKNLVSLKNFRKY